MKILAYVIVILFFLGLVGKVAEHEEAIKELHDTPITVAKVDMTEKTVMQIALMEKEIDMLKLRVSELEENGNPCSNAKCYEKDEPPLVPLTRDDEPSVDLTVDDPSCYVTD